MKQCPAATNANPHELAANMHRHCPDRTTPCKWVICGTCNATIQLPTMTYFLGGALR